VILRGGVLRGAPAVGPPILGESPSSPTGIVGRAAIRGLRPMTPDQQTQPIDAFDTAEFELPAPAEPSLDEIEAGRPSWEPDDGDFS
jgi:hypothetical protein